MERYYHNLMNIHPGACEIYLLGEPSNIFREMKSTSLSSECRCCINTNLNCIVELIYCITTDTSVPGDTKKDLLNVFDKGHNLYTNVTTGSFRDQARFEKLTSRRRIKNFERAAVKKTIISKYQKKVELHGTTGLIILILRRSLRIHLLQSLLLRLMSMVAYKTDKSKLLHKLDGNG